MPCGFHLEDLTPSFQRGEPSPFSASLECDPFAFLTLSSRSIVEKNGHSQAHMSPAQRHCKVRLTSSPDWSHFEVPYTTSGRVGTSPRLATWGGGSRPYAKEALELTPANKASAPSSWTSGPSHMEVADLVAKNESMVTVHH